MEFGGSCGCVGEELDGVEAPVLSARVLRNSSTGFPSTHRASLVCEIEMEILAFGN